jgi:hypothetical protein
MPAFFSNPVQVQLRESQLMRDGPDVDNSAQFTKDAVWKDERSDPLRRNTLPVTLPRVRVALQV